MPPKGWRKTQSGYQPTNSSGVNIKDRKVHGIQDLLLPRSLIAKISKESLPENMPLPRDGVTALMRSATMFTSYITAEASNIARLDNRKTITHMDILKALEVCNFPALVAPTQELVEQVAARKESNAKNKSASQRESQSETVDDDDEAEEEDDEDFIEEDIEPEEVTVKPPNESKRARTDTAEQSSDGEMQVD